MHGRKIKLVDTTGSILGSLRWMIPPPLFPCNNLATLTTVTLKQLLGFFKHNSDKQPFITAKNASSSLGSDIREHPAEHSQARGGENICTQNPLCLGDFAVC